MDYILLPLCMSAKKPISLMRNTLVGIALLLPLLAQASETDAIAGFIIMIAVAIGWIIFHFLFFIRYVTKRTISLMICLIVTSLGFLIPGLLMYFYNPEPSLEETAIVFMLLGLVGPLAIIINKPIKKA